MAQPTLDERFAGGPPSRSRAGRRTWLNADERRFILWGLKERWAAVRIAKALAVSEPTVRRFRRRYRDEPLILLELGLYEMVGKAADQEYRCLVCAERIVGRRDMERHILEHYVDPVIVDQALPPRSGPSRDR